MHDNTDSVYLVYGTFPGRAVTVHASSKHLFPLEIDSQHPTILGKEQSHLPMGLYFRNDEWQDACRGNRAELTFPGPHNTLQKADVLPS